MTGGLLVGTTDRCRMRNLRAARRAASIMVESRVWNHSIAAARKLELHSAVKRSAVLGELRLVFGSLARACRFDYVRRAPWRETSRFRIAVASWRSAFPVAAISFSSLAIRSAVESARNGDRRSNIGREACRCELRSMPNVPLDLARCSLDRLNGIELRASAIGVHRSVSAACDRS